MSSNISVCAAWNLQDPANSLCKIMTGVAFERYHPTVKHFFVIRESFYFWIRRYPGYIYILFCKMMDFSWGVNLTVSYNWSSKIAPPCLINVKIDNGLK